MAHEYHGHREMHVAHRRAKHLMRTGGYAVGGGKHPDIKEDKALISRMLKEHEDKEMEVEGKLRHTRLDKRARGGAVGKFADGGGIKPIRKITPSKHKPHVNVNVVNIHRGHPRPPLGGLAAAPTGLPAPLPAGGAPLAPPPIAPRRPPIAPMAPMGGAPMGMKRGGGVKKQVGGVVRRPGLLPTRALPQRVFKKGGHADGGRIGVMRKGNKAGQATGEHRLEEFHHMGGKNK